MAADKLRMECNEAIDHNALVEIIHQSEYYKDPKEKAHLDWLKNVSEELTDQTLYLPLTLGKCPRGQISLEGKTCACKNKGGNFVENASVQSHLLLQQAFPDSGINFGNDMKVAHCNGRRICIVDGTHCKHLQSHEILCTAEGINLLIRRAEYHNVPVVIFNVGGTESKKIIDKLKSLHPSYTSLRGRGLLTEIGEGFHLKYATAFDWTHFAGNPTQQLHRTSSAVMDQSIEVFNFVKTILNPRLEELGMSPLPFSRTTLFDNLKDSDKASFVGYDTPEARASAESAARAQCVRGGKKTAELCRILDRKVGDEFATTEDEAYWNDHRDKVHGGDDDAMIKAVQSASTFIDSRADEEMSAIKDHLEVATKLLRDPKNHGTALMEDRCFFTPSSGKYRRTYEYVLELMKIKPGDDKYWKRKRFEEAGFDFTTISSRGAEELNKIRRRP